MTSTPQDDAVQEGVNQSALKTQAWTDENIALGGVCDFCADPIDPATVTTWVAQPIVAIDSYLDPDTLGTGTGVQVMSDLWAACPKCDPVVAQRDPEVLADHVIANPGARAPRVDPSERVKFRDDLLTLYTRFFESARRMVTA